MADADTEEAAAEPDVADAAQASADTASEEASGVTAGDDADSGIADAGDTGIDETAGFPMMAISRA